MTTAAEKHHLDLIASMNCVLCGSFPVHVHHLRTGVGMGQRQSHFLSVPLCPSCHQGPEGIHGNRALLKVRKLEELDLLSMTIQEIERRCHADRL